MATKKENILTKEMLDEAIQIVIKAHKDQLDRIEGEVNFVKQDVRDIKITIQKSSTIH